VNQVQELEAAILARAERLANEYRQRARNNRDRILREAAERLRLRDQREEAIAKALAERTYRQQVQANELKLQSQLDQVRWNLVRDVEHRLAQRMKAFVQDEAAYLPVLRTYLAQSARIIERDELVAEVNAEDLRRLTPVWDELSGEAAPDKTIELSKRPLATLGGLLLRSRDNRIRIDNTFEGRRARLSSRINQTILERLLPASFDSGTIFTG
jgi:V/A-type H+-transporting ATPase subunit E